MTNLIKISEKLLLGTGNNTCRGPEVRKEFKEGLCGWFVLREAKSWQRFQLE